MLRSSKKLQANVVRRGFSLQDYAVIGDGRSLALLAPDGTAVWWCAPNLDSQPLFDSLLDPVHGGFFSLQPSAEFSVERRYRQHSNVLETTFTTTTGVVCITEAMNSTLAGRLPWSELARRIQVLSGKVHMRAHLVFGTRAETLSPWLQQNDNGTIFHVGPVLGMLKMTPNMQTIEEDDRSILVEGTQANADWLQSSPVKINHWVFP